LRCQASTPPMPQTLRRAENRGFVEMAPVAACVGGGG
jgi:hypothetical protein